MGNHSVWEPYWRVWKGWKCLLECSTTVDLPERKIFSSSRSLSNNYPGAWRGHAWRSGLHEDFSLPSLQTSLPQVSTYKHAAPCPCCMCVYIWYVCKYIRYVYGGGHICHMPHMWNFFNVSIHIYCLPNRYIYIHSLTFKKFFSTCSDGSIFEKWIIATVGML